MVSMVLLKKILMGSAILLSLVAAIQASGQYPDSGAAGKNLSLNVHLLDTGQALVVGYVDDPRGLIFLRPTQYTDPAATRYASRYRYENETHQLYAWTDALTFKQGDTWRLMFQCPGFYAEYRVIFDLPADLGLGRINSSEGLKYVVSASNDSLTVISQGYDIRNPSITIEYQQSLAEEASLEDINGSSSNNFWLVGGAILSLVLLIGSVFTFMMRWRRNEMQPVKKDMLEGDHLLGIESQDASKPIYAARSLGEIEVGSELNAVLETLTPRERSIMEILIKHGGRMTQMDMRYETGVPKSTLTMVLISLEKRNLVTRKEWGRTNVVELSERFFSGEKHS